MLITKTQTEKEMTFILEGRLDTTASPDLEEALLENISGITSLIIDMKNLAYISSAGIRVVLSAQKLMNKQGTMVVKNVNEVIMEVFEITGFTDILTIE